MVMNVTLERMEGQIKWYSQKSAWNQDCFKKIKVAEIIAAALVPFAAGLSAPAVVTGLLGVIVVVLEGLQNIYQFQNNWITYRSTAEALKHEKYLWYAKAGQYLNAQNPEALLADRIESLISTENAKWATESEQVGKAKTGGTAQE
jgi:phosphate/sulfate permease